MKKIINKPEDVVSQTLQGLAKANPQLIYTSEVEVISRREKTVGKVGVVSGGGSGHEPAHAGYVGKGMLDAAVAGNMFSSPSPDRIIEGIRQANSGSGVLLVIKNYSGDIMNFELAQQLAEMEGIEVDYVVVRDDVAVEESTHSTGRRGIAGTVLVHKIAGAMAETGASLSEVKRVAQKAIDNLRSMGMAMTPCTLPAVGKPGFSLDDNEIEIGMGIHGEPGVQRRSVMESHDLANTLLEYIMKDKNYDNTEVALLVNGLGGTPLMELYILNNDVCDVLESKNIKPYSIMVGNYMTAIEMAGCSLSLMELDDELKALMDAPCSTTALVVEGE